MNNDEMGYEWESVIFTGYEFAEFNVSQAALNSA